MVWKHWCRRRELAADARDADIRQRCRLAIPSPPGTVRDGLFLVKAKRGQGVGRRVAHGPGAADLGPEPPFRSAAQGLGRKALAAESRKLHGLDRVEAMQSGDSRRRRGRRRLGGRLSGADALGLRDRLALIDWVLLGAQHRPVLPGRQHFARRADLVVRQ